MNVRKTDYFIADVERQFGWWLAQAGWEVVSPVDLGASGMAHSSLIAWRTARVAFQFFFFDGARRDSSIYSSSASTFSRRLAIDRYSVPSD
jgi:hypothetical protein